MLSSTKISDTWNTNSSCCLTTIISKKIIESIIMNNGGYNSEILSTIFENKGQ